MGKLLGKGAFGKVNLALHKLARKLVAMKSINKKYLQEDRSRVKFEQEVSILRRLRHQNVVKLFEMFGGPKHSIVVMELCAGGDLLNYVRKRRRVKEEVAKHIIRQVLEALGYMHSRMIIHRDIKLDNILLDQRGTVKVCDFGVSRVVHQDELMEEQCGTPAYMAPEVICGLGYQGYASDMWSAGIVLYAMLYGNVPFRASKT